MKRVLMTMVFLAVAPVLMAQQAAEQKVPVEFRILDVGRAEIDIILLNNEPYLPVGPSFGYIGIRPPDSQMVSQQRFDGIFKSGDSTYSIDLRGGQASYGGRTVAVAQNDYLVRDGDVYLRLGFMNAVFGLDMRYLPRRLQIEVRNSHTLPMYFAIRRQQSARRNLNRFSIPEPDVYMGRSFDAVSGARLDWSGTTRFSRDAFLNSRALLSLGADILGGDFSGKVITTSQPHSTKSTWRGRARFPVFDTPALRQIVFGNFVNFGLLPREMTGLEITNRPPSVRHVFAREVFSGVFDPKIDVTLTGTAEAIQLQQTDDQGMYQVDAPILYGQGLVEVHAYDQWGQERVLQYRMNVPRSLVPPGEVEYSAVIGRFRLPTNIMTSSNYFNWGVTPELTVGGKVDYYDFTGDIAKAYAGLTATARITRGLFFNGLVVPTAFSTAALDWSFPSSAAISLQHTRYGRNSFFNPARLVDETNVTFNVPISAGTSRFSLTAFGSRTHLQSNRDDELQVALNAVFTVVSPRIAHRLVSREVYGDGSTTQSSVSSPSLGLLLPAGLLVRTEFSYDWLTGLVRSINADVVKRFSNGLVLGISYFRLPQIETYNIGLRLEYYFPFVHALTGVATPGSGRYEYTFAGSGSVGLSLPTSDLYFENRPNYVGYGGFVLHPFLDANGNGRSDPGEQRLDKGRILFANLAVGDQPHSLSANNFRDDRILGYEEYNLYLDPQSLDNPILVPQYNSIRMMSEPNFVKRVDIPVVNGGFVRGTITTSAATPQPAEGIKVILTAVGEKQKGIARVTRTVETFSTGEFEFSGVPPGSYSVTLDPVQLDQLNYNGTPASHELRIVVKPDGDVVADQDFRLTVR